MLSEMCIKREKSGVDSGSQAYYESRIYINNNLRETCLRNMEDPQNDLITLSTVFLANMKESISQQIEFINMFAIQPDTDEQNELKIVSKGWYTMLRRQLMKHHGILATASNQAADCDRFCKIAEHIRLNCKTERRIARDSIERYPPAGN
ncbi:uncharacterized protein LOC129570829 isoform X1 [Sitodiplosis mosellana]|nr:uncharacterized protein LOC129570829 isoform X1 [Sitodiplosis mosellana]